MIRGSPPDSRQSGAEVPAGGGRLFLMEWYAPRRGEPAGLGDAAVSKGRSALRSYWAALLVAGGLWGAASGAAPESAQPPRQPAGELREGSFTYQDPRLTQAFPPRTWRIFLP